MDQRIYFILSGKQHFLFDFIVVDSSSVDVFRYCVASAVSGAGDSLRLDKGHTGRIPEIYLTTLRFLANGVVTASCETT